MTTVTELINTANSRTSSAIRDANTFIRQLEALIGDLFRISVIPVRADPTIGYSDTSVSDRPLEDENVEEIAAPNWDSTDVGDIDLWQDGELPTFTEEAPTLTFPDKPDTLSAVKPDKQQINPIEIPDAPNITLPTAPELNFEDIENTPRLSFTEFSESYPDYSFLTPTSTFSFVETEYSSDLKTAVETLLYGDLTEGGYGINDADEAALFSRVQDREVQAAIVAEEEIAETLASRGFPVTGQGIEIAELRRVQDKRREALSDVNREIMLRRSDLYVQARQFAVTAGTNLESILINYHSAKMERALNTAKISAELAISVQDLLLRQNEINHRLYAIRSNVNAENVRTQLAKLEEFKVRLETSRVKDQRIETEVQLYRDLLTAANTQAQIYVTEMQGAKLQSEIETLKLDQFQAEMNAYIAEVRAYSEEWSGYATAVQAEGLRLEQFQKSVDIFKTRAEVEALRSDIGKARFDAQIQQKTQRLALFERDLAKYRTQVEDAIASARQKSHNNEMLVKIWDRQIQTDEGNRDAALKHAIAQAQAGIATHKNNIDGWDQYYRTKLAQLELNKSAADSGIRLYENMIAGAESSLQFIGSLVE